MRNFFAFLRALSCVCALASAAVAETLAGSLATDDQTVQYTLNLSQSSTVTAQTTSYASGGFVPVLSLFNQAGGAFVAVDGGDASCSDGRMVDQTTGLCNDAYLSATLSAGTYVLAVSEFDNYPNGNLAAGFSRAGQGDFTSAVCDTSGGFWETDLAPCVQRTASYSVNLSSSPVTTPEPATAWFALPATAIFAYEIRRRRRLLLQNN